MAARVTSLAHYLTEEQEDVILEGLRTVAASSPDKHRSELAQELADAIGNDTWLAQSASGPDE